MECEITVLDIVKDYQTLIASVVALTAAIIAFRSVVYAQHKTDQRAKEDRQSRESNEAQKAQEARASKLQSLTSALTSELSVAHNNLGSSAKMLGMQSAVHKKMVEIGEGKRMVKMSIGVITDTTIFDAVAKDIGTFEPLMAGSLAKAYSSIKASTRSVELKGELFAQEAVVIQEAIIKTIRENQTLIHDVIMRLHSLRLGHGDPGIGKGGDHFERVIKPTLDINDPAADEI